MYGTTLTTYGCNSAVTTRALLMQTEGQRRVRPAERYKKPAKTNSRINWALKS